MKIDPMLKAKPVNLWNIEKIAVGIFLWMLRCGDKGRFLVIFFFNNAIILDHNLVFVGAPIASSSSEIAIIIQSLLNEIPSGSNGDINGDGIANILDIISIVNIILDSSYTSTADINYDNIVNILDIIELVNLILSN